MSTQISKRALSAGLGVGALGIGAGALALMAQTQRASADTSFTNFAFPGTGAPTPRTMPDRLAEVKNVKDYGAVGDGVKDDTAAIQAALNAAYGAPSSPNGASSNLNSAVFFPAGNYRITAPLTIKWTRGAHIFGSGMLSTNIQNSNSSNPSVFVTNGVAYSTFEEMSLAASPGGVAFDYNWDGTGPVAAQINTFKHIWFQGGAVGCRVGAGGYQCDTSTWINCFFGGCTTAGLLVTNLNSIVHNVYGGNFASCATGIFVPAGSVPIISGVGFENQTDYDIRIQGGARDCYLISGCSSESKNFFINTNIAMSHVVAGCCQRDGGSNGVFAEAGGCLSLTGCWSVSGEVRSGNADATLSIDNCKFERSTDFLANYQGKIIHYPLTIAGPSAYGGGAVTLYSQLPASPKTGMEANITDATVNSFAAAVTTGGGGNHVKVRYNGKNWTVMGA